MRTFELTCPCAKCGGHEPELERHLQKRNQTIDVLLKGVPVHGGTVNRKTLKAIVVAAFNGGVVAELESPGNSLRPAAPQEVQGHECKIDEDGNYFCSCGDWNSRFADTGTYREQWQAHVASLRPGSSQVSTPFVCDDCAKKQVNWYGPCPHAVATLAQREEAPKPPARVVGVDCGSKPDRTEYSVLTAAPAATPEDGLQAQVRAWKERAEQAETQLAGCGVAALGWSKGERRAEPGDWGYSASYQDVLNLRERWEALRGELEAGLQLVESAFAHVSHGGPTRTDAEKWINHARAALAASGGAKEGK